jgi:PAS domain S-box-containing protein
MNDLAVQELSRISRAALPHTDALLAGVLDAASEVSIIATDPAGLITVFNRGAERLLGYTAEEMVGKQTPAPLHLPAEVGARGIELTRELGYPVEGFRVFVELQEKQGAEQREWTYVHKNGELVPVSLVVTAMRSATGEITGYVGIAQNITERKSTEAALKDQARETQAILDHMVDGLITIDGKGIIASFNHAAERIFGYSAAETLGQNVKMLMPQPHRDAHDGYLHNYQTTGVARIIGIGREVEGQRKDGSLFPMELAVSAVTRQGAPLYVGMVRDITERKRMERMKTEFVSTVSHELRTPLTSISGALGLMAGGAMGSLPDQARSLIDIAHKNSKRLTHLINDLLDMEKIAAGKMHFDMQVHALVPLIEQALEGIRSYGVERTVKFTFNQQATEPEVRVDSQRLMQVLSNLLSNAVKYSPEGGTVDIAVRQLDGQVRVAVTDQGPGIPAEFRSRIFQKFSQADSSDTRQKGGTGLGLAITKELVERMGGRIGFESEEGKGASFYFLLPLCSDNNASPTTGRHVPATADGAPWILVVEDEPDIAKLLSMLLTRAGYNVDTAANGTQALQALKQSRYAAMTLDLMLPDIGGLEIIRQVRDTPETADLPIVVVSAKMEEGRLAINGDFGGIDWLAKPIDENRLLSSVERQLPAENGQRLRGLHVEDDADMHQVIRAMVGGRCEFELATSLAAARMRVEQEHFDVVVLDLGLPDGSGWDLLPLLRTRLPAARIVILSGSEMSPDESGKVEAALLKSRVSSQDLLNALQSSILQSRRGGDPS